MDSDLATRVINALAVSGLTTQKRLANMVGVRTVVGINSTLGKLYRQGKVVREGNLLKLSQPIQPHLPISPSPTIQDVAASLAKKLIDAGTWDLSKKSDQTYQHEVILLTEIIGNLPVTDVKPSHVSLLISKLRERGCSDPTIRSRVSLLRRIMAEAVRQNLIKDNPIGILGKVFPLLTNKSPQKETGVVILSRESRRSMDDLTAAINRLCDIKDKSWWRR